MAGPGRRNGLRVEEDRWLSYPCPSRLRFSTETPEQELLHMVMMVSPAANGKEHPVWPPLQAWMMVPEVTVLVPVATSSFPTPMTRVFGGRIQPGC